MAAVKYNAPLTPERRAELLAVAKLNDDEAEATQVTFPSGKRVLLVRCWRYLYGETDNLSTTDESMLTCMYEPGATA